MIHLLPCPCGQDIPVETRQAGESVVCPCGRTAVVPMLSELRRLPPAASRAAAGRAAPRSWGVGQGIRFIGITWLILSVLFLLVTLAFYPRPPRSNFTEEDVRVSVADASPTALWHVFENARLRGLQGVSQHERDRYEEVRRGIHVLLIAQGAAIAIGIGLTVLGSVLIRQSRQRRAPSA